MTYEFLIEKVHGKAFDRKLFVIFFFNGIQNAMLSTSLAILLYSPPIQRCNLPDYVNDYLIKDPSLYNKTVDFFLPQDPNNNNLTSKCLRYNRSFEDFLIFWNNTESFPGAANLNVTTEQTCWKNKESENPYNKISATMEFDLTCEKSWIKPLASTLYMAGNSISTFFGILSDKYGRKAIFCLYATFVMLATFALTFSYSLTVFLVLIFTAGIMNNANYASGFVLGAECTIPSRRNYLSVSSFISFAFGYGVVSLFAYITPDWRWMYRAMAFFQILLVVNFWLIPRSPRWLLSNGKFKEAKEVLLMIAKYNNKTITPKDLEHDIKKVAQNLVKENSSQTQKKKALEYFTVLKKTFVVPRILLYFVIISISWASINIVYFGISLSVQELSGNIFINNTVMGLVEIPGLIVAYLCVKYLNRPLSHGGMIFLSGLFCLTGYLFNKVDVTASTISALIGKSLSSGAFYVVYIHTVEVFPTNIRNTLFGLASTSGRLGGVVSPYIVYLGELYGMHIAFLLMSIIGFITGSIIIFGLPDTNKKELPDLKEETLQMSTLFDKCFKKKQKIKNHREESFLYVEEAKTYVL